MSASLNVSHITLRVADLRRSAEFYTQKLGFAVAVSDPNIVDLSVGAGADPILRLLAGPSAPPPASNAAGLFHAALLFPTRANLGAWLKCAAERGVEFDGFSDHAVSEAIYFADPEGNGLEFYADRPREQWPVANGQVEMVTRRLDVQSLIAAAAPASRQPLAGAQWGHLHLRITDLARSERFYCDALGMQVTQRTYPGARFLAADGYHHHLGLNVWGRPTARHIEGCLGLAEATFARRALTSTQTVIDPDGIHLRLVPIESRT